MADNNLTTRTLTLESRDEAVLLFGNRDQHLRLLRDALGLKVVGPGRSD